MMKIEKISTTPEQQPTPEELHDFYTCKLSKNRADIEICLDRLRITNRLRKLGYFRYDRPDGSMCYVYINNGQIKLITETKIMSVAILAIIIAPIPI